MKQEESSGNVINSHIQISNNERQIVILPPTAHHYKTSLSISPNLSLCTARTFFSLHVSEIRMPHTFNVVLQLIGTVYFFLSGV